MFHPTARRLDEPYKIGGFTVWQWLTLLLGGGGLIALLRELEVGIQLGGFVGTLLVGVPAIWWLMGESGRIEPGELVVDAIRHSGHRRYAPGAGRRVSLLIESENDATARRGGTR